LRPGCDSRGLWKEIGGNDPGGKRLLAPLHLVEEIVYAFDGRQQGRARRPFYRVTAQSPEQRPVGVVDSKLAVQGLRGCVGVRIRIARCLAQAHMAIHPVRQAPSQPQLLPAEGKIGGGALGLREFSGGPEYLEATVQHQRVNVQAVPFEGLRERHFAKGLAGAGPDPLQRAEERSEIDAGACPMPVVRVDIRGLEIGLELFEIDRLPFAGRRRG